jgi:hypothetical protein
MAEFRAIVQEQTRVHIQHIHYLEDKWRSFCFFNGECWKKGEKVFRFFSKSFPKHESFLKFCYAYVRNYSKQMQMSERMFHTVFFK